MAKYLLYFEKRGLIKYTSHLDLLRIYKRAFKKAEISLSHSEGYNPHPKVTFGQPLSLGYEGAREPLEFETLEDYSSDFIIEKLNDNLPKGLKILEVIKREEEKPSIAKTLTKACYKIRLTKGLFDEGFPSLVNQFMDKAEVMVFKESKKKKTIEKINIRPLIIEMEGFFENKTPVLSCVLMAGSSDNLSPELVIKGFFEAFNIEFDRHDIQIERLYLGFE